MIKRRQAHANLKAHEEQTDDQFVDEMCVNFEKGDVVDGKCDE